MDQREYGDHAALQDAVWRRRVRESARADVKAMLRGTRRRRVERWLVTAMVLAATVAVVMLLAGVGVFSRGGKAAAPGGGSTDSNALTVVDMDHPFELTPAAQWADGAAGIEVPPAMQVGEFSAAEVADATHRVRDVLVASRLDQAMLRDHDPSRYLALLAPDNARQLRPLFGTGREQQAQALVSMVDKGTTLSRAEPKVKGTMTVSAGGPGELVVRTNYVFAYAFTADPAQPPVDPMSVVVVVRADIQYVLLKGTRWTEASQGLWYRDVNGFFYSISCDAYHKGFIAPAYQDKSQSHSAPRQDKTTYFNPDAAVPAESGCPN